MVRLTLVLVIINAVYAAIATGQLFAIREQARIARRTLVDIERAWVLVEPTGKLKGWIPNPERADGMVLTVKWGLSNHGRSPAWIERAAICVEVLPLPLPDTPTYGDFKPFFDMPITHRKDHGHDTDRRISATEFDELCQGTKCLAFYGVVEYRDVIGKTKERRGSQSRQPRTRFCCRWEMRIEKGEGIIMFPVFVPGGPPGWIEYT